MNLVLKFLKETLLTDRLKVLRSFDRSIFDVAIFAKFWHFLVVEMKIYYTKNIMKSIEYKVEKYVWISFLIICL
jgi:hypothetical protein